MSLSAKLDGGDEQRQGLGTTENKQSRKQRAVAHGENLGNESTKSYVSWMFSGKLISWVLLQWKVYLRSNRN